MQPLELAMNVVMLGRPGAGKGTQSQRIASRWSVRHLSTGELLRAAKQQDTPLAREIGEQIDAGNFVTDELALSLVEQAMQPPAPHGYVFDGMPRTVRQDQMLSELLARHGAKIDLAIHLEVDEETVRSRLLARATTEGRLDDAVETVARRLAVYDRETRPLVDSYRLRRVLVTIDGRGTTDQVFGSVLAAMDEMTSGEARLNAD